MHELSGSIHFHRRRPKDEDWKRNVEKGTTTERRTQTQREEDTDGNRQSAALHFSSTSTREAGQVSQASALTSLNTHSITPQRGPALTWNRNELRPAGAASPKITCTNHTSPLVWSAVVTLTETPEVWNNWGVPEKTGTVQKSSDLNRQSNCLTLTVDSSRQHEWKECWRKLQRVRVTNWILPCWLKDRHQKINMDLFIGSYSSNKDTVPDTWPEAASCSPEGKTQRSLQRDPSPLKSTL